MSKKSSRKILSDLRKLYSERVSDAPSDNPITDFKKLFSNPDSRFFINLPNGDLEEI
jgi:hypothetical protein